ncbi:MAG: branched-chain amino acid ABC transporter permease [Proteobacteria bacterium]|nr:branched-chain amino acid ABC transporter permease [Pseudomonadota bacterium]MBU1451425.1 branched-chain amino acid ABC transporter permease [Pseudomonadota bacterium]MBU2468086.1 branched-chain amino acid ABC transporter permease [Pseudomonadota bacterium]MBU2517492.1 branched-chain amino acid ABC transporter permease [Pseudomonadota bacterium]
MAKRKERIDRGIKVRSEDIFALTSWREMLYLAAPRVVPVLALFLLGLVATPYWERVLITTCMFALLAISWDLLNSAGMVSLGQALFFGVGAYIAGTLNHYLGLPPALTIPIATVGGGALCTLALLPVLRLRGIYFAMVTLILPLMIERVIEATKIFGGTEGISGLSTMGSVHLEFLVAAVLVFVALFGFRRMMGTDYGLLLKGISDNDRAVMSAGMNIYVYKAQALFMAASVGSFAGAFMTHAYQFVGMPVFALDYSIIPIASVAVGGMGTLAGPMLGSFILVPLSELLRGLGGLRVVIYAVILVVCTVGLPEGIFHYLARKYNQFERWVGVER